jgi:sec-independent protein translocase protein TatA
MTPLIAGLGTTELLIIFGVIILLFGAAKLPELARGSGRALRIFKAETKGLMDDDEDEKARTDEAERRAPGPARAVHPEIEAGSPEAPRPASETEPTRRDPA